MALKVYNTFASQPHNGAGFIKIGLMQQNTNAAIAQIKSHSSIIALGRC